MLKGAVCTCMRGRSVTKCLAKDLATWYKNGMDAFCCRISCSLASFHLLDMRLLNYCKLLTLKLFPHYIALAN